MTIQEMQAAMALTSALVDLDVNVATKLRGVFKAADVEVTDDELNQIIRNVQHDARERQALAKEDAAAARREGQADPPEPAA